MTLFYIAFRAHSDPHRTYQSECVLHSEEGVEEDGYYQPPQTIPRATMGDSVYLRLEDQPEALQTRIRSVCQRLGQTVHGNLRIPATQLFLREFSDAVLPESCCVWPTIYNTSGGARLIVATRPESSLGRAVSVAKQWLETNREALGDEDAALCYIPWYLFETHGCTEAGRRAYRGGAAEIEVVGEVRPPVLLNGDTTTKVTDEEFHAIFPRPAPPAPVPAASDDEGDDENGATRVRRCGNCRQPGHTRRTCTNPAYEEPPERPHAHILIGCEVEGLWTDYQGVRRRAEELGGVGESGDGSISRGAYSSARGSEFQTRAAELYDAAWQLHRLYPDETNRSCGFHIHMSFSPTDTGLLATSEFFAYFKARWEAWGAANNIAPGSAFWHRLRGDNNYCKVNVTEPRLQDDLTRMERFHQVNFSAWTEHRTVEQRLLPMFRNERLSLLALKETVDIFDSYLAAHAGRVQRVEAEWNPAVEASDLDLDAYIEPVLGANEDEVAIPEYPPVREGEVRVPWCMLPVHVFF